MNSKDFHGRLKRRAQRAGVDVSPELSEKLHAYYALLHRWNQKINLTALNLDSGDDAIDRLLVEPLVAARAVARADRKLIDIGSGGGSPAIPLALASPGLALTMVEVKVRKSAFLREVVRTLGMNATVWTSRFEALLSDAGMHETYDVLSLRAVRADVRILAGLQAFVRPGGRVFLFRPMSPGEPDVAPPLAFSESLPLVESLRSQLVVLTKQALGRKSERST